MAEKIHVKQLNDTIYLLDDDGKATAYLVVGQTRAALIDTAMGSEDFAALCRSITPLPVTVINTHGHSDHIMGNVYFTEPCLMHPADLVLVQEMCETPEVKAAMAQYHFCMPSFAPIRDGDEIDLGGLTLQVIGLPGHTRGSVCLLLKEQRVLFTGDAINRHLWAQLDHCLPMHEIVQALDRIMWVQEQADTILHGHAKDWEPIGLLSMMRSAAQEILETDHDADPDYKWFGGVDKHHPYDEGRATICYRPDHL